MSVAIARRTAGALAVLWVVSVVIFAATQALPSDPARAILGRNTSASQLAALRSSLGLNRTLISQYWSWLSAILHGDLGTSLVGRSSLASGTDSGNSVSSLLGPRLVSSVELLAAVAVVAIPLAVALGTLAAVRRDRLGDSALNVFALILTAMPEFVIGMALAILFATNVRQWLPAVVTFGAGENPLAHLDQFALPVATLVLATVPYLFRLFRASMIDALDSEYVAMARLKGIPERQVVWRHAVPNALLPLVQASGLVLIWLLGGIVVVEFLFNYPGIGTLLTQSIASRDIPTIQATTLAIAAGVVLCNMVADVLTTLLTPKLRTGGVR